MDNQHAQHIQRAIQRHREPTGGPIHEFETFILPPDVVDHLILRYPMLTNLRQELGPWYGPIVQKFHPSPSDGGFIKSLAGLSDQHYICVLHWHTRHSSSPVHKQFFIYDMTRHDFVVGGYCISRSGSSRHSQVLQLSRQRLRTLLSLPTMEQRSRQLRPDVFEIIDIAVLVNPEHLLTLLVALEMMP